MRGLPDNPSAAFKAANPTIYAHKTKIPRSFEALQKPVKESPLEEKFLQVWRILAPNGEHEPRREFKFCPTRKWKFDCAWPAQRVFVELEGGVFDQGRHTRAAGFIGDCEKYNQASFLGWVGFRIPTGGVNEEIVSQIQDFIRRR